MSESDTQGTDAGQAGGQQAQQQFGLQRIYVKDVSFETPNSPSVFTTKWEPEVKVDLDTKAGQLGEGVYEVVLSLTVTATLGENTAYLAEVHQAGIFSVAGFGESDLHAMLYAYCPGVLFPYAREVISDLVTKGSFPQMLLAPINFDAVYQQRMQKQQAQA